MSFLPQFPILICTFLTEMSSYWFMGAFQNWKSHLNKHASPSNKKTENALEMFYVYPFAAKAFNLMLISSTPPQGQKSISFDKRKDLGAHWSICPQKTNCNVICKSEAGWIQRASKNHFSIRKYSSDQQKCLK